MPTITPEAMSAAQGALEMVRDSWLRRPGVTAIDLGFKWRGGQMTDELAIRVHVAEKKSPQELDPDEIFPEQVAGVPVDVIEATYQLQPALDLAETNGVQNINDIQIEAAVEGRDGQFQEIPLGVSIGSQFSTAGTLGAKVIDLQSGAFMILSNWHVLAGSPQAAAGQPIWQPGQIDHPPGPDSAIAELSRWVLGPYDAAVARLNDSRPVRTTTLEGRPIEDITPLRLGMTVWKSGRSTGLTGGFVDGVQMQVPLDYPGVGVRLLEQVCRIIPRPGSPPDQQEVSSGGDSGAVWVEEASGKAVALHFAGEVGPGPEHALAHDIGAVVNALQIRFPRQSWTPAGKPAADQIQKPAGFWQTVLSFIRRLFGLT